MQRHVKVSGSSAFREAKQVLRGVKTTTRRKKRSRRPNVNVRSFSIPIAFELSARSRNEGQAQKRAARTARQIMVCLRRQFPELAISNLRVDGRSPEKSGPLVRREQ